MLRYAFDPPQSWTPENSANNWEHAGVGLPLGHSCRSEFGPRSSEMPLKKPARKAGLLTSGGGAYAAASFSFFSARTFNHTVAGLTSNQRERVVAEALLSATVRAEGDCAYRSKTRGNSSGAMPTTLSRKVTTSSRGVEWCSGIVPDSGASTFTVITPPCGVYLTAFPRRFEMTCVSRGASAKTVTGYGGSVARSWCWRRSTSSLTAAIASFMMSPSNAARPH